MTHFVASKGTMAATPMFTPYEALPPTAAQLLWSLPVFALGWAMVLLGIWHIPETVLSGEMKRQHADRILGTTHAFISTIFGCLIWTMTPMCRTIVNGVE